MRRSAVQLVRRLPAFLPDAGSQASLNVAAAAAAAAAMCLPLLSGAATSCATLPAAAAPRWHSFSTAAAAGSQADTEATEPQPKPQAEVGGYQQVHRPPTHPANPESHLGKLMACETVAEQRAWRDALVADNQFGPAELSFAIRILFRKDSCGTQDQRQAYLRELMAAGVEGGMQLDAKTAAYLLWGPAKANLRGQDVQRVLPAVFRFLDDMKSNDLSTCMWAMGVMNMQPDEDLQPRLLDRFVALLPEMRVKELTASAVGVGRLSLPESFAKPLIKAYEEKLSTGNRTDLHPQELERIVKIIPHLPHLDPASPFCRAVFEQLVQKAPRLTLYAIAATAWAAGSLKYRLDDAQTERLVEYALAKLHENNGTQVQALLHGLNVVGYNSGDGPVTHEFVQRCVESQLKAISRGRFQEQIISKLLFTLSSMNAAVSEEVLQQLLDVLVANGLQKLKAPWRVQMIFRRLKFKPGMDALESMTHYGDRLGAQSKARRQRRRLEQQQDQEVAAAAAETEAEPLPPPPRFGV